MTQLPGGRFCEGGGVIGLAAQRGEAGKWDFRCRPVRLGRTLPFAGHTMAQPKELARIAEDS